MSSSQTQAQNTSAADTSIGFDFQFYYFLYRLLNIKENESVGLEIEDDVSSKLQNDRQILIQLKHTIQTSQSGNAIALTTLDSDLWKTISNWSKIISDKNAGREYTIDQLEYVRRTDFLLASNKIDNQNNKFIVKMDELHKELIDYSDFKIFIQTIKTEDKSIQIYIKDFLSLNDQVAEEFIMNLGFELNIQNIIDRCKSSIKEKMVIDTKLESIFQQIDSQIRQDFFHLVVAKKHLSLTFEEFHKKYKKYFDLARSSELQIQEINPDSLLSNGVESQNFIKQLLLIEDIELTDVSTMVEYTRLMLRTVTNIDRWLQDGDVTKVEVDAFHNEAMNKWRTEFNYHTKQGFTDDIAKQNGRTVLYNLRKENIAWTSYSADTCFSNGEFYHLSNKAKIGWHIDWKKMCQ